MVSRGIQEFPQAPDVAADPCRHRWRYPQGFVNPAKIVERKP
jgi:hypothetical protein